MGTGTRDMIRRCGEIGLPNRSFPLQMDSSPHSVGRRPDKPLRRLPRKLSRYPSRRWQKSPKLSASPAQVSKLLSAAANDTSTTRDDLQASADLGHREHFRKTYLEPLLTAGWPERTIPTSRQARINGIASPRRARPCSPCCVSNAPMSPPPARTRYAGKWSPVNFVLFMSLYDHL